MSASQPDVPKDLRDAMGKSQQDEIGNKMDFTEQALRAGMPSYAVMREAPVTRDLNELKDEMKRLEANRHMTARERATTMARVPCSRLSIRPSACAARSNSFHGRNPRTAVINREISKARATEAPKPGERDSKGQSQQGQRSPPPPSRGKENQGGQQSAQNGQQGGQQPGGQQVRASRVRASRVRASRVANSPQAAARRRPRAGQGGGNVAVTWLAALSAVPANGGIMNGAGALVGPGWQGDGRRSDQPIAGDLPNGQVPPGPAQAEALYGDLMRDLGRLRGSVADDKDAARQYQELVRQAQQLDPKRWATNGQLSEVIGGQLTNALDQVELLIRRKMDANDGSVRSTNPRNTPPGYADAYSKYTKSLSKQ